MATLVQDPRLTLLGAGFRGDAEVEDGVHLRWSFDPDLGFPPEGFHLFHRRAQPGQALQVSLLGLASQLSQQPAPAAVVQGVTLHRADGELLPIGFRCDRVAFDLGPVPLIVRFRPTFAHPARAVREVTLTVVADKGGAMARSVHAGRVAGCAALGLKPCLDELADPADVSRWRDAPPGDDCLPFEITLRADAIDEVQVTGCNALLLALSWRPLRDDECDVGWKPLFTPICLPVEDAPEYPCQPEAGSARDVALARLPDKDALPPGAPTREALEKRLLGADFDDLRTSLERAVAQGGQLVEHLPSEDPEDATSWRHDAVRDALTAAADPYFARILGLYRVHLPADPDATFDYKIEAEWPIGEDKVRFCWVAFGLGMQPQPALPEPTSVRATAQAGGAHVTPDGVVNPCEMDVVVGWRRPTVCELSDPVRSPIAYFVERTEVDGPDTGPYHLLNRRVFEEGGEPEVVPAVIVDVADGPERLASGYYLDRGPGYGTFHYRVRGMDLFGRTSGPSGPVAVEVRDEVPPGPPLNLAAAYADPADPDREGGVVLAWANRDLPPGAPARPAVALRWVWPASRQRQSPDLDEFRLYYRSGSLNQVLGRITAVAPAGGGRYDVTTDLTPVAPDFPAPQGAIDLGALRSEGEECPIVTIRTVGGRLAFGVRASAAAPPLVGPCTFRLGSGTSPSANQPAKAPYPAFRSYEVPDHWGGLVLGPTTSGQPRPLRIGADGAVRTPLPPGLTAADAEVVRVLEPEGGGVHWHYQLTLRGVVLAPTTERPRPVATFGISACDVAGNEGRVAPPASIFTVQRVPPVAPQVVYPPLNLATPADYHGTSWFTLTWTGVAGVGYLVYRAIDLDLLAAAGVDLAVHRARTPDEQRLELQQLGRQTTHVAAFRLVTPAPLRAGGGPMSYRDPLPGSVLNRFVYRARAVDGAGNLSPWPAAGQATCVVVDLPGEPPVAPAWSGAGLPQGGVALRWAPDPGPGPTGYRLYRAYDPAAAEDVRSMVALFTAPQPEGGAVVKAVLVGRDASGAEVGVTELPPGQRPPGRLLQYVDATAADGRAVYYRLVAEDGEGRRSQPSDLLTVQLAKRSRPSPPVWGAPAVTQGSVALSWTAGNGNAQALLLRRTGGGLWRPLRPWGPAGDGAFTDSGVDAGVSYEYRVRLRDEVGHVVDGPVLTVEAV